MPYSRFALLLVTLVLVASTGSRPFARQPAAPPQEEGRPPAGQAGQPAPAGQEGQEGQPGEGQEGQPSRPIFRTDINFVRVDVIVTDKKGQPIEDLTAEDFEVTEDGEPQVIESFQLFKIDQITETTPNRPIRSTFDEEQEAQRPDVRLFGIFLDDYHVRRGNAMRTRQYLADFVRNTIAPQDMVGIMYPLTPTDTVVMTRNHEATARAIEQFDGRKYDYQPRNIFEEQYHNYPAVIVEQIRNQVSLGALRAFILKLGGLREGRKALLLVSEGYTHYLPPSQRDPIASMPGYGNPMRGGGGFDDSMGEQRARWFSNAEMLADLREIFDLANKFNVAIYAVDPRGLAGFEHDINEGVGLQMDRAMLQMTMDSIRILASETDGRAIVERNDLTPGLRQIVRDSSSYYLLGYNSSKAPSDGKFHEIKVRVKRRGVDVRHRKGYWALTPEETARATAPPAPAMPKDVEAALASLAVAPRRQFVHSWIGLSRGENGKTRVTYVWEPADNSNARGESPAQVQLMVIGTDGSPYYRGSVPREPVANPASNMPRRVTFEVPPGRIQMKMVVKDGGELTLDSDTREITVPDLAAPEVRFSTPAVFRARTAHELQALRREPDPVPTVDRVFHRSERLVVRAHAYGPGTEVPTVKANLLNRMGQPMQEIPVQVDAASGAVDVELPLAGIAPGEYLLELRASGQGGEARELVAFRVGA
ncbi:MAG TPA: VWA domain-containing protein [Vicinamibacterales bacterium]